MPPTPKYFGEQDPRVHGGRVHYPGGPRGYPLRLDGRQAAVPMPRGPEYEQRTRVVLDFKAAAFCTWDPASLDAYRWVMDRVSNRSFFLRHQDRQFIPGKGWWFWVEWLQPYETPEPEGYRR